MLKFLFVISFGFGIPTKYSDSLKCNHGVQSSLIGDLLVCHYFHGTQAQWSKGAQGFQACLDLALRFWFLNLREVGLGTILSYGLRTIWILCTYIYIYTRYIRIYIQAFCTFLHLWAFSTLTDSSLDGTIETMETPWSESKALGALHSRAGIPSH